MRAPSRTHREVEIKLAIADIPALIANLRRRGAEPRERVLERNTLYDTRESDLWRRGYLLRLRVETPAPTKSLRGGRPSALLTFKSPVPAGSPSRYKERLEREQQLASPRSWPQTLRSIGLRPGFRYEKYRTKFHLPGLHLDLDETPAGDFLEMEGEPRKIQRVARALGFSPRDYFAGTYWDIYAAECRRRGRIPKNMLFRA